MEHTCVTCNALLPFDQYKCEECEKKDQASSVKFHEDVKWIYAEKQARNGDRTELNRVIDQGIKPPWYL